MRLFLASYGLGSRSDLLAAMVRGGRRGWTIANALDGLDEERRRADGDRWTAALWELGLEAADLDLRAHDPGSIGEAFGRPDFVWVRGGNVFTLRTAMARSGLDVLVQRGIRKDAFVYAGFSAGACVLAPSLAGLERCDPVEACRAVYGEVRFDGLGVLDRPVVPHLGSPGHPESALLGDVAAAYDRAGQPYWGLRDGQVLVEDGSGLVVR